MLKLTLIFLGLLCLLERGEGAFKCMPFEDQFVSVRFIYIEDAFDCVSTEKTPKVCLRLESCKDFPAEPEKILECASYDPKTEGPSNECILIFSTYALGNPWTWTLKNCVLLFYYNARSWAIRLVLSIYLLGVGFFSFLFGYNHLRLLFPLYGVAALAICVFAVAQQILGVTIVMWLILCAYMVLLALSTFWYRFAVAFQGGTGSLVLCLWFFCIVTPPEGIFAYLALALSFGIGSVLALIWSKHILMFSTALCGSTLVSHWVHILPRCFFGVGDHSIFYSAYLKHKFYIPVIFIAAVGTIVQSFMATSIESLQVDAIQNGTAWHGRLKLWLLWPRRCWPKTNDLRENLNA